MSNVNVNKSDSIKLIKNYIHDLSFENPQNINENNSVNLQRYFNENISYNFDKSKKEALKKFLSLSENIKYIESRDSAII